MAEPRTAPFEPPGAEVRPAPQPVVRISPDREDAIDAAVESLLARGGAPGAVVLIGRSDGVVFRRAYGRRAVVPDVEPMTVDTVFDLASVTKAVATATSVMWLVEAGRIDLDAPISGVLPQFTGGGRERITVRHLLTHTSGLPAVNPLPDYEGGREAAIRRILGLALESPPGARVRYSDLGFIVLGVLVERVTGRRLDEFARDELFEPLGMRDTRFVLAADEGRRAPVAAERRARDAGWFARVAPTERAERRGGVVVRGAAHDPRAWRLGGVAGNAGLFSTGDDLARFARMLLGRGELDGVRVLQEATVLEMVRPRRLPGGPRRALGWDTGRVGLSEAAFGHGGFTGTSFWVDPEHDVFVILLTNRVHPDGRGDVQPLVRALGPLAVAAAAEAAPPLEGPVLNGIDVLERDGFAALAGARVALLTHRAARTRDGRRTLDVLHAAPELDVVRILTPEHGLGASGEGHVADGRDLRTGLPVFSLFGRTRAPTAPMLEGIDTVVVDLQDVGVRFYTYGSTVRRVLTAAAERDLRVVVLDRPDPQGGLDPVGPVSEPELESFVNHHPLPTRHGLTLGELATLLNEERSIGARVEVVELENWRRGMRWRDTGLRWVPPSPNLRTPEQAMLYPALALLEGTNVSVGRGTDSPFQVLGAPWIDAEALSRALADVPGVRVEPTTLVPRSSRHRGQRCRGVRVVLTEPDRLRPVRLGLRIARALRDLHAEAWDPTRMLPLLGDRAAHAALLAGESLDVIERGWTPRLAEFARVRRRYLRYE